MGHRHLSHKLPMFETDQDQNLNRLPVEQPYGHMGRMVPDNNYPPQAMGNSLSGTHYISQWDTESRRNDRSSSSICMEVPHARAAALGSSYDPFPYQPAAGGCYLASGSSASHAHSGYNNRQNSDGAEGGTLAPTNGTGRGPLKRKGMGVFLPCERGSTSRYLSAGSSSSSSEFRLDKPTLDHHVHPPVPMGLPRTIGGSLSVSVDDSLRNVRSRPRLDVEPNPRITSVGSYSSHHCQSATHLTNNHGPVDLSVMNADAVTHDRNCISVNPSASGRFLTSAGCRFSYEPNQFNLGGSTAETGRVQQGSISRRNPVSHLEYRHGPPAQVSREGYPNYSRRDVPTYRTGLSYPHPGHEVASSGNGMQFLSGTHGSRNSRPLSTGGWRNNYRNGRTSIPFERFESLPHVVDARGRMESEAPLMGDGSFMYDSRNSFDQYTDMRLDIDDMSYEELLALGERIGHVNTGLTECIVSKCLMETEYCSSAQSQEEATSACAICLEEYKSKDKVGTVNNCGHDYHVGCIKKWLSMKNACPICKSPALPDTKEG